jgi:hypothetical protein
MLQHGPVADYLDALALEVSFDPTLSRRLRAEVEDHLLEAAAAWPGGPSAENQAYAIAQFGDPAALAQQFVPASLLSHIRWSAGYTLLAIAAIFVAMEARVAWYGLVGLQPSQHWLTASALWIDRCAFALAVALALAGCGYAVTRRAPARCHPAYRRHLDRCVGLCVAAATALLLTVLTETVLTAVRVLDAGLRWEMLVPAGSLAAQIVAAALLVLQIRNTIRTRDAAVMRLDSFK